MKQDTMTKVAAIITLVVVVGIFILLFNLSTSNRPVPRPDYSAKLLSDGNSLCADEEPPEGFYCVRVFYGTTRLLADQAKLQFGEEYLSRIALGFSDVRVPLMKSRFFSEVEDSSFHPLFDKSEPLRQRDEISNRVAVRHLKSTHPNADIAFELEAEVFVDQLGNYLELSDDSILLYVHGMNQSFDVAVSGAAQLAIDLTYNDDRPLDTYVDPEKLFAKGYPVLFSWPNTTVDEPKCQWWDRWCAWVDGPSQAAEVYTNEVQLAARSSEELADFIELLALQTETKKVNIVMHSMGNRVFMESLPYLEEKLGESDEFREIDIRIIHAASEYGYIEHWKALAWLREQNVPFFNHLFENVTIYTAETDGALFYGELNRLVGKIGSYYADMFDLDLSSLGPNRIYNDIADVCRVGLWSGEWLSLEGKCLFPFTVFAGQSENFLTVDATDFDLKYDDKEFKDYGHDYFINSPAILSDMSCSLDKRYSPSLGARALVPADEREDFLYWAFDPESGSDPACKVVEWREPTEPFGVEFARNFSNWFGASLDDANSLRNEIFEWARYKMQAGGSTRPKPKTEKLYVEIDDGTDMQIPFVSCDTITPPFLKDQRRLIVFFDLWSDNIKPSASIEIREFVGDIGDREVEVIGFADRAGDESTNRTLAYGRATAVVTMLVDLGIPINKIEIQAPGETMGEFDLSDSKIDSYRCAMNRRAEIKIKN